MRAFYCDHFVLPLPSGHKFPVEKYQLLRAKLLQLGILVPDDLSVPAPAAVEQIQLVHTPEYVRAVFNGELSGRDQRRIGFPWSPQLVERSRRSVGGTVAACHAALAEGIAVNLAGGTHHAFPDRGEGFCVFNDVAIAARVMLETGLADSILVVDCDVHQGNGTAAIFRDDPTVFTFSMHGQNNYPFRKEQSDVDLPLADGVGDEEYLDVLDTCLQRMMRSRSFDLAFYVSGADPFVDDRLGRLALSKSGLAQRDCLVLDASARHNVPVVVVMAGGYARLVRETVDIHLGTVAAAAHFSTHGATDHPLGYRRGPVCGTAPTNHRLGGIIVEGESTEEDVQPQAQSRKAL